jgi:hypothetical protein
MWIKALWIVFILCFVDISFSYALRTDFSKTTVWIISYIWATKLKIQSYPENLPVAGKT